MFEQTFKNIDDILHKDAGCTSELDYTEQSSWLLFLKYLDALENNKATEAELEGRRYSYILDPAFRRPKLAAPKTQGGQIDHNKALTGDDLRDFVLFHYVNVVVQELDQDKLTPLLRLKYNDSLPDAVADLGARKQIQEAFVGFKKFLHVFVA